MLGTLAYAALITLLLGLALFWLSRRRVSAWLAWPLGLAFCWGVELWQLSGVPAWLSAQWIGWRLTLGTTFDWRDVALYPVGVAAAELALWAVPALRARPGRPSLELLRHSAGAVAAIGFWCSLVPWFWWQALSWHAWWNEPSGSGAPKDPDAAARMDSILRQAQQHAVVLGLMAFVFAVLWLASRPVDAGVPRSRAPLLRGVGAVAQVVATGLLFCSFLGWWPLWVPALGAIAHVVLVARIGAAGAPPGREAWWGGVAAAARTMLLLVPIALVGLGVVSALTWLASAVRSGSDGFLVAVQILAVAAVAAVAGYWLAGVGWAGTDPAPARPTAGPASGDGASADDSPDGSPTASPDAPLGATPDDSPDGSAGTSPGGSPSASQGDSPGTSADGLPDDSPSPSSGDSTGARPAQPTPPARRAVPWGYRVLFLPLAVCSALLTTQAAGEAISAGDAFDRWDRLASVPRTSPVEQTPATPRPGALPEPETTPPTAPSPETPTTARRACTPGDLRFELGGIGRVLGGNGFGTLQAVNRGEEACWLQGRPSLGLTQAGRALAITSGLPETQAPDGDGSRVALGPGQRAEAALGWRGYGASDPAPDEPQILTVALRQGAPAVAAVTVLAVDDGATPPASVARHPFNLIAGGHLGVSTWGTVGQYRQ
jgi:hypothetical protein